jgi:hypothetical protein
LPIHVSLLTALVVAALFPTPYSQSEPKVQWVTALCRSAAMSFAEAALEFMETELTEGATKWCGIDWTSFSDANPSEDQEKVR